MDPPTLLELDRFLPYRLSVLSNRISQDIARLYAERFGLGVTQWRILAVVGRYPGLSATELAERTAMDKVAVSRAVNALIGERLLSRQADGADRRRSRLRLSLRGRRSYDQIVPLALEYERRLLSGLSADERQALQRLLGRLDESERAARET